MPDESPLDPTEWPRYVFHAYSGMRLVHTPEEEAALSEGWRRTPFTTAEMHDSRIAWRAAHAPFSPFDAEEAIAALAEKPVAPEEEEATDDDDPSWRRRRAMRYVWKKHPRPKKRQEPTIASIMQRTEQDQAPPTRAHLRHPRPLPTRAEIVRRARQRRDKWRNYYGVKDETA